MVTSGNAAGIAMRTLFVVALVCAGQVSAQTPATWDGSTGDNLYGTAGNWDIDTVPLDAGLDSYEAIIPTGQSVYFGISGTTNQVTGLDLAYGSSLTIQPSCQLTVTGQASIGGSVSTLGGVLEALSPSTALTGTRATLAVSGGGRIALGAASYSSTGLNDRGSTYTLLSADGAGSVLDLSDLKVLDTRFNDSNGYYTTTQQILASSYGQIDLSGVQTLYGSAGTGSDGLLVGISSMGDVDLSSLADIPSGINTRFSLSVPSYDLPSLLNAAGTSFLLTTDTALSLPALVTHSGGTCEVPNRASVSAPALTTANGATISVDSGGTFSAPALRNFLNSSLTLKAGQTITLPAFESFDNSRLTLRDGTNLTVAALNYASTGLNYRGSTYTLFDVSGASGTGTASQLDLSSLTDFNAGFSDGNTGYITVQKINATDGGQIDMSEVQTLTGSAGSGDDRLEINIANGASVDLSSLTSITGLTRLNLSDASLALPSLQSAASTSLYLATGSAVSMPALTGHNGGTVSIPDGCSVSAPEWLTASGVTIDVGENGTLSAPKLTTFTSGVLTIRAGQHLTLPAFINFDDSRLTVRDGVSLAVAANGYASTGLNSRGSTYTLFDISGDSGTGTASRLDLSSLTTFNAGFTDGNTGYTTVQRINATDGGQVDMSEVQTLTGSAGSGDDRLEFNINTGGSVDLSSLTSITGLTRFNVSLPAFSLHSLQSASGVTFDLTGCDASLNALATAAGTSFTLSAGSTANLPLLVEHIGGTYTVPDGTSVSAPQLLAADGVTIDVGENGTLSAPKLTTFTTGVLTVRAGQHLTLPAFVDFDDSRLTVRDGMGLAVAANGYASTGLNSRGSTYTLFDVSGASGTGTPSRLDLASLLTLDAGFNDLNTGYTTVHRIVATDGGQIDLSGVRTMIGSAGTGGDRLEIDLGNGGSVNLNALVSISGLTQFHLSVPTFGLPSVESAAGTTFDLTGCDIALPVLASASGCAFHVDGGSNISAPSLVSADGSSVSVDEGGSFRAPSLTSFTGGTLSLLPGRTVETGLLDDFDNSRITITGGESLTVAAAGYTSTGLNNRGSTYTLLDVSGGSETASLADLSSLTTFDAAFDDYNGGYTTVQRVVARDGGQIDLSGVESLNGAGGTGSDRLELNASGGGWLDLSSLTSVSGRAHFSATSGGRIDVGSLVVTPDIHVALSGLGTEMVVHGNLHLDPASSFSAAGGATIRLAGNFSFGYTDEALLDGDDALFHLEGPVVKWFEVGGADLGVDGATSGNFGLAQLTLGSEAEPVIAFLVDLFDNGNRASPEALYLYGNGPLDGLELLDGSTLYVGNINVYAMVGGEMTCLNDLFAGGERIVPFDGGFLGNQIAGDANLDNKVGIADLTAVADNYGMTEGATWTDGDFNFDGKVGIADLTAIADNYGTGAGGSVPEPTVAILLVAGAAILRRRRG